MAIHLYKIYMIIIMCRMLIIYAISTKDGLSLVNMRDNGELKELLERIMN